ncbi:sialidase family protein [Actinomadura opuntiae]|uniref:sialidase family protein n=1 Tax=Actinomadura sp. OS1-43 TaxID=604315 RepID=UPI00255B1803|nr:sialidase family protein [Actinomadura sp. OS1-43]MDL4819203.1 sialidase family protein [Actinomadura sp. OS1-43]
MTARTPERGETASPADDRPAGSRQVRRRLTFGVAGDLADLPAALSPWQRAYEAWRTAGIGWGHGAPPRDRATEPAAPASRNAIRATAPPPEPEPPHKKKRKRRTPKPRQTTANPKPLSPTEPAPHNERTARPAESAAPAAKPGKAEPPSPTPADPPTGSASREEGTARPAEGAATASEAGTAGGAAATGADVEEAESKPAADSGGRRAGKRPAKGRKSGSVVVAASAAVKSDVARPDAGEADVAESGVAVPGEPGAGKPDVVEPGAGAAGVGVAGENGRGGGRRTVGLRGVVAGAAGLVLVAGGALFVVDHGDGKPEKPRVPAAVPAGAMFAADPAATVDGLVQDLAVVAASGRTVVAAGTEGDGTPGRERVRFLVSADGGRAWRVAKVRGADGSEPPAGERPRLVAAGTGSWVALGQASGGTVVWLSDGGATWTRHLDASAFKPGDQVNALAATAHGYVAVGAAGGRAVVWSTADGRAWQRIDGLQAGITGLDRLAASGNVLVTHGTFSRKVTRKKGKKKVTRTVRGDGLWRSADGGRTWTAVNVPQAQGSYGSTNGLVAGPGGFATVREGQRTTGRKKHRRTTRHGVLFTSADGLKWQAKGQFSVPGYAGVERFGGSPAGLGVLVKGAKGQRTMLRSADGRVWQPSGTVAGPVVSSGLAVAAGGAVMVAGHQGGDAYLSGVNLAAVPGAVHIERTIRSLAAGPGRAVAVGSTNGGAAIWSSPDGRTWQRGRFPAAAGVLSDVAFGKQGWLAVGRASGPRSTALAMTSQDGTVWQRAPMPAAPPAAVASGPAGYVAVGGGAAWRSTDLRTWKRATVNGNLTDVVATATGYAAVGGRDGKPAVWTSPDGAAWTQTTAVPPSPGPLAQVAARGNVLVTAGTDANLLVSADAGRTWAQRSPAGARQVTALAATPKAFVAAVTTAQGDAAVFGSADGAAWSRVPARGLGGRGDQRLTAMAPAGGTVLGTGTGVRDGEETPLLWRAPAPVPASSAGPRTD